MKPWLALLLGAGLVGAAIATRRRGSLGAVRLVPEWIATKLGTEIDDAEARARAAGARGALDYIGAGGEGVVLCDEAGQAFKVAREGRDLHDEAEWLQAAGKIPSIRQHVPRRVRYDAKHRVLVRECLRPSKRERRPNERRLWELHERLAKTMHAYGWGRPEFKPDSYVYTRERGPVLVDAGFAVRRGRPLVREVLDVLNHRRAGRIPDLAWDLRMERGETVPAPVADKLLRRLKQLDPSIEI